MGKTRTWITELESGRGTVNPRLERFIDWAEALGAQEFGIYVVLDGDYISATLVGEDLAGEEP
jgi:transcriptional regulator with XRE-family HTH domain